MEQGRETLDQIRERIDIVSLVGRYIELKRAGRNFTARCPFHNEKTPSFIVSPEIQHYKCFGCGKAGDIFTFIMEYEHVDFRDAMEKLAKEAGVKIVRHESPDAKKYAILEMINQLAADFFRNKIDEPIGSDAQKYLTGRKFDQSIINRFNLGYSPGDGSLFRNLRGKANFTDEQLLQSGLFSIREGSKTMKEKFYQRVMFPIQNERGKVIAFSGRIMPKNELGPKYLNSPDTPIYHKKNCLYGIFQAKQEIRKNDLAIICEGQPDTISCHKIGVQNIVAPLGTALTDEQVSLLKRFSSNILLLFNSDSAGQAATERAFILCTKQNINTYSASLGQYKDLDEIIQKEPDTIQKIINEKQDAFTYLLSHKLATLEITKYEDYKTLINFVNNLLQNTTDTAIRSFYLEKAEKLTGVAKTNFDQIAKPKTSYGYQDVQVHEDEQVQNVQPVEKVAEAKKFLTPEEYYLYLILQNSSKVKLDKIETEDISNPDIKEILAFIVHEHEVDTAKITEHFKSDETKFQLLESLLLSNFKEITSPAAEFDWIRSRVKLENVKRKITLLRQAMSIEEEKPEPNNELIDKLSAQIALLMGELKKLQTK